MTVFIHLSLWGLSIPKALHINVWEMAGVTAMAGGGEQTQSAHACDVNLGARIFRGPVCWYFQSMSHTGLIINKREGRCCFSFQWKWNKKWSQFNSIYGDITIIKYHIQSWCGSHGNHPVITIPSWFTNQISSPGFWGRPWVFDIHQMNHRPKKWTKITAHIHVC